MATRAPDYTKDTYNIVDRAIEKYSELVDVKFDRIEVLLQNIEKNVIKQNGNVAKAMERIGHLERKEETHVINCPHKVVIQTLRDDRIKTMAIRKYLRNWVVAATVLANVLVQIILYVIK